MKYIKTYESSIDQNNNKGVNLDDPFLFGKGEEPEGARFKIDDYVKTISTQFKKYWIYQIKHYYINPADKPRELQCFITIDDFSKQWVYEIELILASPEEVEEYELKKASVKYNI